jgi:hypothetical protein
MNSEVNKENKVAIENREVLLVGMSATSLLEEQEIAFKLGMHFFCQKPANLDVLLIILQSKQSFLFQSNKEIIEQICILTGTNAKVEKNESFSTANKVSGTNIRTNSDQSFKLANVRTSSELNLNATNKIFDGVTGRRKFSNSIANKFLISYKQSDCYEPLMLNN